MSWNLKTERVVVFKDGYSLIIKRGVATTDKSGEVFTDEVPDAAVLGSFWAVPEQGRLISMLAGWKATKDDVLKELPCTQPIEILLANKGKQAKVELFDKTLYSGVIQEVLVDKTAAPSRGATRAARSLRACVVQPAKGGGRRDRRPPSSSLWTRPANSTLTAISGSNFVLRTDEGDMLLPVAQVRVDRCQADENDAGQDGVDIKKDQATES